MRSRSWLVWSGLAVVALIVGLFAVVLPARSQATDLQRRANQQVVANEVNEQRIAQYRAQAPHVAGKKEEVRKAQQKIPPEIDQAALIREIQSEGQKTGVTVARIDSSDPIAVDGPVPYKAIPVQTKAEGTYLGLKNFVNGLERMERAYLIERVAMTEEKNGDSLRMTLHGKAFTLPQSQVPTSDAPIPTPETGQDAARVGGKQKGRDKGRSGRGKRDADGPSKASERGRSTKASGGARPPQRTRAQKRIRRARAAQRVEQRRFERMNTRGRNPFSDHWVPVIPTGPVN